MAERALYNNLSEPEFPFTEVKTHLEWLPSYCDSVIHGPDGNIEPHIFDVVINTVLVCVRARTSTVLCPYVCPVSSGRQTCIRVMSTLVERFNHILRHINAQQHYAELYLPYKANYFVVCKRNPRFNWLFESQVDIGRNLDFFAAGHIVGHPFPPRGCIRIYERETLLCVYAEIVLLDSLSENIWNKLKDFNNRKESLYNETMTSLGLPYRFKWVFANMERRPVEFISKVVSGDTPPSEKWWDDNCLFVAGLAHDDTFNGQSFCTFTSRYREFWPLIQRAYTFCTKYRNLKFDLMQKEDSTAEAFWNNVSKIFGEIKDAMSPSTILDHARRADLMSDFTERLAQLANEGDRLALLYNDKIEYRTRVLIERESQRSESWSMWLDRKLRNVWWVKERIRLNSFERYKLTPRLVYEGVPAPPSGYHSFISKL